MAVDRGYGSGKPLSATQSASRRAAAGKAASRKETVTAAAKKYGQKKNMMYTNPGMLASQKKRTTLDNRRTSANALENLTGFNSRDGVDAGDVAGLALAIPAGIGGAVLKGAARVARAVAPTATRVAKAATRVSRAAKAKGAARESMLNYEVSQLRGNQSFARSLQGFPESKWDLDQFGGFRNISRTTRRSDIAESAYEIQSRLDALKRAKKNR